MGGYAKQYYNPPRVHPSEPNYLALFSGSLQGVNNDACPFSFIGKNLASLLIEKGLSFVSYAESLPQTGLNGCVSGAYVRKHNPIANWKALESFNQSFDLFPQNFAQLPTVAFVIPNMNNDMHDGSIELGDVWLAQNIEPYAQWAMTHNSLLIVTWDEDNRFAGNHIATILIGPMVKPDNSAQLINHYNILRTIEEMMGLAYLGDSAKVQPISGVWLKNESKEKAD